MALERSIAGGDRTLLLEDSVHSGFLRLCESRQLKPDVFLEPLRRPGDSPRAPALVGSLRAGGTQFHRRDADGPVLSAEAADLLVAVWSRTAPPACHVRCGACPGRLFHVS